MQLFALVLSAITLALPGTSLTVPEKRQTYPQYNIHPNGDRSKCIGVSNGVLAAGSAVTIFDCNGQPSQKWASWGMLEEHSPLSVTNPTNGKKFCIVFPDTNNIVNGAKLRLQECRSTDRNWYGEEVYTMPSPYSKDITSTFVAPGGGSSMCVDLTDGSKANRNVLQFWQCAPWGQPTYQNQIWTLTRL